MSEVQRRIEERFGLTASIGIGPSKLVAKMAAGLEKPRGLTVLDEDGFRRAFWPTEVRTMWGVGPKLSERMGAIGIVTVGDLAHAPAQALEAVFGIIGPQLKEAAWGRDETPLVHYHQGVEAKSMGHEVTLAEDCDDPAYLEGTLLRLSDQVARRLRSEGYRGRTVAVKLLPVDLASDPEFVARAKAAGRGILVGGEHSGQGSSREVAAIALVVRLPDHVGVHDALLVAGAKGSLVALVFMHLKAEKMWIYTALAFTAGEFLALAHPGTLEPHGVINNGADNTAPFAMAKTIARRTNAMIAPTLPYGITGSLEAYPGAFQITESAYRPFVKQILEGLAKNGFRSTEWIAAMPDVHWGMGATVGSVIPTKGAIIPAAVGVDIDRDGKSVWVFDRCATADDCSASNLNPIQKFDASSQPIVQIGVEGNYDRVTLREIAENDLV